MAVAYRSTVRRPAVERLQNVDDILTLLRQDRLNAAYPLGDRERSGRPRGDWYLAGDTIASIQRMYRGATLWATGSSAGLAEILNRVTPPELYYSGDDPILEGINHRYRIETADRMIRMAVTAGRFRPTGSADRLSVADTDQINRLYRFGAGGQITRQQVADGVYFGIAEDGRLVSVAGTHFVNADERIGAIGNVFTHPAYRGRGLATRATSAVTMAILDRCRDIVLNVAATNAAAQTAYRRLGFRDHHRFVEGYAVRRPYGPLGWLQRLIERMLPL